MIAIARARYQGVTLFEVLLALSIASSLVVLGIRHYQTLRRDVVAQQITYNVDQLFEAAAEYYQGNCRRQMDPSTGLYTSGTGKLDPANSPANPYPVTVSSLTTDEYFTGKLQAVPVVNMTGVNNGYIVQFNRVTPDPDRTTVDYTGTTNKTGSIIVWRVQIAVELKTTKLATIYKNLLAADCISTYDAGNQVVYPCSAGASAGGKYIVWERLPSYAVPNANSNLWSTNATLKRFNEMYNSLPMVYLTELPAGSYPQQNYLCGG